MPPWLLRLIEQLNQIPEPNGIIQTEILFIRLCRLNTPERYWAFEAAYGNIVNRLVNIGARLYPQSHGGRRLSAQEVSRWREEIEDGFYEELRGLEADWAQEFGWVEQLINFVGFDPYSPHWTRILTNTFNGYRRSLRRLLEEYADIWIRERLLPE